MGNQKDGEGSRGELPAWCRRGIWRGRGHKSALAYLSPVNNFRVRSGQPRNPAARGFV